MDELKKQPEEGAVNQAKNRFEKKHGRGRGVGGERDDDSEVYIYT